MRFVEGLADRMNRLSLEERRKFRSQRGVRDAWLAMTDEERARYLELTLPTGMKQMMEAFNQMPPERRKQIVNRAVNELQRAQSEGSREEMSKALGDENLKRVVAEGFKAYLKDADASAKLDMQPLLEQVQGLMQMTH